MSTKGKRCPRARERIVDGEYERWCNVHRGWWPLRLFSRNPKCKGGFTNECRGCRRSRQAKYRLRRAA